MAQTVCVIVSSSDRARLKAISSDRNRQQKHAERARVVSGSIAGHPVHRLAAALSVSRPMIWRWQQRFAEAGVDGLLRDKTRKPGKPPIAAESVAHVVALTCADPPHQATHWTGRAMADAAGISVKTGSHTPSLGAGCTPRSYLNEVARPRTTLRTVARDTAKRRTISLIGTRSSK
jgi:transposase